MDRFFASMALRFASNGLSTIDLAFESMLACRVCGSRIMGLRRLDPRDVETVDREGFLGLIVSEIPVLCAVVDPSSRGEMSIGIPAALWSSQDGIAYGRISCICGRVVGAHLSAVTVEDIRLMDAFWMVVERLAVTQGNCTRPLETVLNHLGEQVLRKDEDALESATRSESAMADTTLTAEDLQSDSADSCSEEQAIEAALDHLEDDADERS
jgi:hypothetical protein